MTKTTKQHTTSPKTLSPKTIAAYRAAATRPSVVEHITQLNQYSWHHEVLDAIGATDLADGAERAWLHAALRLAATPARSAAEAHLKVSYLSMCLTAWVTPSATATNHMPHAVLITAAVASEECRWGHPDADAKPN